MPSLLEIRHRQGLLLGRMKGLGFRFRDEAALENLTAEVVKSSAIEGNLFDPASVRSSLVRRMGGSTSDHGASNREIEGAVEMMVDASQNYTEPLTEERLFGWQTSLFPGGRGGMHRVLLGQWRTSEMDPMQVVSGRIDRERVRRKNIHFEAPDAERLSEEMTAFLHWFETPNDTDLVLRAGIAHLWFLTIHRFEDGNGRVGRAIADLALARADDSAQRFYSMSAQIESEKQDYYDVLEKSQKGTTDITFWLEWFLGCLGRALQRAEELAESIIQKSTTWEWISQHATINKRQRIVINTLLDGTNRDLSTSRYAKLAQCSLDTALRDIKLLLEDDVLITGSSGGRSTKYQLRPPPEE